MKNEFLSNEKKPYKIPNNWCWLNLLDSFENKTDSKKKIRQEDYLSDGDYAVVDQGKELIGGYTNDKSFLFIGDTPVIVFGDHTRCIKYIDFPFVQGADGVKILKPKKFYNKKCFFYALKSVKIPNMGYRRHYPLFKNLFIPLPPLAEQQRIVNRIESLFSKLDEAKQRIQDVLDSFEVRKAVILHQAFTGKLTAKWRKEHGIENDSWINTPFEDCTYEMQNGLSKRHGDIGEKVSVLRLANILDYGVSVTDLRQIVLNNKEKSTYLLDKGDALMVRVNGSKEIVGKQVMISKDREWAFCDHLIRIKYEPKRVLSKYMVYYSKTQRYREYIEDNMVSSAGQNTISRKGMAHLEVQLPTLPEQIEILQILEDQIGKQQQTKELAERTLVQIDLLKKSILARAFRGELGTNDPKDEKAVELLKRVLQEE